MLAAEAKAYLVSFPRIATAIHYPVEGCQFRDFNCTNLRIHLSHRHMRDTIIILEEGNCPHPCLPKCDMFIPWKALNWRHPSMEMCTQGW